ncbi:MAG TPA: PRC-barrel domain-containing protein [Longimicrobiales bacterium]|nr:PRC-barrel domain-containing protein [Longimicrobiales bacterium]
MALRPISRLDGFTFPEGAWDVRGWTVRTQPDDRKVGKVEDMLLDHAGGLRYLDVNLGFLKKHVLVPLDHAHAEEEGNRVWIRNLTRDELERVPEYALDPESLDEAYERRLDATYGGTAASRHRDLVAPTPDEDAELSLQRMARLEDEYRVAGDDPRGWKLVTADGRSVGRVAELLVDPGTMKARFMDVALDEDELELEPVDRHVLLPVDRVRLDRKARSAVVAALMGHDLADYPQYGGLPVRNRAVREIQEYIGQAGLSPDERRARNGEGTAPRDDDWRDSTLRTFYGDTHRTRRTPPREPTTEE